ncbi:MAG: hypothetical protein DRP16_00290 [Candidatus Aenigmatarchaeota archaeon]|nr:MAG: hypothetical protein DRP16_00290 [Candidatus Aenigmarchaeota archaeon]
MKKQYLFILMGLFFVFLPSQAYGLSNLELGFIPDRISVNSSFLMVVNADYSPSESIRVSWNVPGVMPPQYGLVPKVKDKWICYFSNTDPSSTCGPSPFPLPTFGYPYEMKTEAVNQNGHMENKTLNVNVGGIVLTPQVTVTGNKVYIVVWASGPVNGVEYEVYKKDLNLLKNGEMEYKTEILGYTANLSLSEDIYYIAFKANSTDDFGGGVVKVNVGVNEEGSSELTADRIEFSAVIDKGQHYEITRFKIKNTGDQNFTNLVVEVPDELKKYLSVDLEKTSLDPMETTYMTVSLNGIESSMEIKTDLKLKTGSDFIMNIPADIKITVMGYQDPTSCEGKSDGEYCLGGICCSGVCRIKAECCNDLDCGNAKCSNYRCVSQTDVNCLEGMCYPGENESACPENTIYTYYKCTINGENGVCCKTSADNECADKSDGTSCSKGICCSGVCVEGDCCSDYDCSAGEVCSDHICQSSSGCSSGEVCAVSCEEGWVSTGKTCTTSSGNVGVCCMWSGTTGSTEGGDYTLIIIVVLVVIGLVGWFAYTKFFKGKKPTEEELEEEFSDEDFY